MPKLIFLHCICIGFWNWHHYCVQSFSWPWHWCGTWAVDRSGHICWTRIWPAIVNAIGGRRCFTFRITSIHMHWYVKDHNLSCDCNIIIIQQPFTLRLIFFSCFKSIKCFPHVWYLSADMQLFIISPLVVYLIHRYQMTTIWFLFIMILGCVGYSVGIHIMFDIDNL